MDGRLIDRLGDCPAEVTFGNFPGMSGLGSEAARFQTGRFNPINHDKKLP
jgi:hypothetical protein